MKVTLYDHEKVIAELELDARTVLECLPLLLERKTENENHHYSHHEATR